MDTLNKSFVHGKISSEENTTHVIPNIILSYKVSSLGEGYHTFSLQRSIKYHFIGPHITDICRQFRM